MYSKFLEASEKGAKAYSTLKNYTKDELIEEIRILEHNLAGTEEMYQRGINRQISIGKHFPQIWKWEEEIADADLGSNWRIMTQQIPIGEDCHKIHVGNACKYCGINSTECKYSSKE